MNEEMSTKLSHELLLADGEEARGRVLVRWLPELVRCQIKTAGRAKLLVKDLRRLEAKVDRLHAKPEEVRFRDAPLAWLKGNWMWVVILLLCLKNNGLVELFRELVWVGR